MINKYKHIWLVWQSGTMFVKFHSVYSQWKSNCHFRCEIINRLYIFHARRMPQKPQNVLEIDASCAIHPIYFVYNIHVEMRLRRSNCLMTRRALHARMVVNVLVGKVHRILIGCRETHTWSRLLTRGSYIQFDFICPQSVFVPYACECIWHMR